MIPEAEMLCYHCSNNLKRFYEGVSVGNLGDCDAHLVPLRDRIGQLERGSRAALQRGPGAAPDYGDGLVASCRFARSEATFDQDIKMPAVQGLERIGENGADIGYEEHGCSRTAVDMHLLEVLARLFHTDHHRREYARHAHRGDQDVAKQPP